MMISELMYIELKTGYNDNGPAWIGYVRTSKAMKTVYFNGHAFRKSVGVGATYYDVETGEEYWISGVKKGETNRHPAGGGIISIDSRAVEDYLALTGLKKLKPSLYKVTQIKDDFPIERINRLENEPKSIN